MTADTYAIKLKEKKMTADATVTEREFFFLIQFNAKRFTFFATNFIYFSNFDVTVYIR